MNTKQDIGTKNVLIITYFKPNKGKKWDIKHYPNNISYLLLVVHIQKYTLLS